MRALRPGRGGFEAAAAAFEEGNLKVRSTMNRLCVIIFGPPGSGKGTQAELLRDSFGVAHISTGDMLRESVASGDARGREIAAIMNSGNLVPDDMVNCMVQERIAQPDCAAGFILDGYPRTVAQAKLLLELLGREGI